MFRKAENKLERGRGWPLFLDKLLTIEFLIHSFFGGSALASMTDQQIDVLESLMASVAGERLVGVVDELVPLQLRHERERLPADAAVERLGCRQLPNFIKVPVH